MKMVGTIVFLFYGSVILLASTMIFKKRSHYVHSSTARRRQKYTYSTGRLAVISGFLKFIAGVICYLWGFMPLLNIVEENSLWFLSGFILAVVITVFSEIIVMAFGDPYSYEEFYDLMLKESESTN